MASPLFKWTLAILFWCLIFIVGVRIGGTVKEQAMLNKMTDVCVAEQLLLDVPYKGRVLKYACVYVGEELPVKEEML